MLSFYTGARGWRLAASGSTAGRWFVFRRWGRSDDVGGGEGPAVCMYTKTCDAF